LDWIFIIIIIIIIISRKAPLWPACVGGPLACPSVSIVLQWEAWSKLMHALNGNTAPAGAAGDASGAYYLFIMLSRPPI